MPTTERMENSVGYLYCPTCYARLYLDAGEAGALQIQVGAEQTILATHDECNTRMLFVPLSEALPPPLTVADLQRIAVRTDDGRTTVADLSDQDFHAWVREKLPLAEPGDSVWPPEERVSVCDVLVQMGTIHLVTA